MRLHTFGLATLARTAGLAALVALGAPAMAHAQSAIIYGSLSNFDISNDTGKVCHGFEVELDGLQVGDYSGSFTSNRYGAPTVAPSPTGVTVTWKSAQSGSAWTERTLQHTVPWFSGQCYQWSGPAIDENGGCEHFDVFHRQPLARVVTVALRERHGRLGPGRGRPADRHTLRVLVRRAAAGGGKTTRPNWSPRCRRPNRPKRPTSTVTRSGYAPTSCSSSAR